MTGTHLIDAAWAGRIEEVKRLLEQGVHVDDVDQDGHTALHAASHRGNVDVVTVLLEAGAALNAVNKDG